MVEQLLTLLFDLPMGTRWATQDPDSVGVDDLTGDMLRETGASDVLGLASPSPSSLLLLLSSSGISAGDIT